MEDTKVIETPADKHKIKIKTWLSARDYRALDEAQVPPEMEVKLSTEQIEKIRKDPSLRGKINPSEFMIKGKDAIDITKREEDTKILVAVISIDDNKDEILNKVLNFKKEDFDFILTEIDQVINTEKKKVTEGIDLYKEGKYTSKMLVVVLCQEMKWTYKEYSDQPQWFLDLLYLKMQRDNQKDENIK